MIRGYATVKGNVRRPRKAATVYRRPEFAVIFGALEANPGSALYEGDISDISVPPVWQGGLLLKGTFTADPSQRVSAPSMSDTQRLGFALLCYMHVLAQMPAESSGLQPWFQWAQAWLDHHAEAAAQLAGILAREWPYPGLKYLAIASHQIATGAVLRDRTPTMITQGMTDLLRIADQHALQIDEGGLATIVQQSRTY